jgi:fumarate hydratase class II
LATIYAGRSDHRLRDFENAAAAANYASKRLDDQRYMLIKQVCDEVLADQHHDMFPLHVWLTGSVRLVRRP